MGQGEVGKSQEVVEKEHFELGEKNWMRLCSTRSLGRAARKSTGSGQQLLEKAGFNGGANLPSCAPAKRME